MAKGGNSPIPDGLKKEVEEKANTFLDSELKPRFVLPPPENPQFNYIEDLYTKWHRGYFYFCAQYKVAGEYALVEHFEAKFARMKYLGRGSFALAFMRYTGQWIELYRDFSLEECLATIRNDAMFQP